MKYRHAWERESFKTLNVKYGCMRMAQDSNSLEF